MNIIYALHRLSTPFHVNDLHKPQTFGKMPPQVTLTWVENVMQRPDNITALMETGGVAAQIQAAINEELQYWFKLLTKFVELPDITPEQRTAAERELKFCRRKLGIKLTGDEIRARNNARLKQWNKHRKQLEQEVWSDNDDGQ
jgi:hypothetical protein